MTSWTIDPDSIRALLNTAWLGRDIAYTEETASTNADARALAASGARAGTVALCARQTAGRGRRGRGWLADEKGSLCFSLILKPSFSMELAPRLAVATAMGVCAALRRFCPDAMIKWPNDILSGGCKLCGILLEAEARPAGSPSVIAGIGINVNTAGFDPDIATTASSILLRTGLVHDKNEVLAETLNALEPYYDRCDSQEGYASMLEEYAALSCTLGRRVRVSGAGLETEGVALALDGLGRLTIKKPSGERVTVSAGDVSLREA